MTRTITRSMIRLKSSIAPLSVTEWVYAIPRPSTKASTSADITPITGGIATVK